MKTLKSIVSWVSFLTITLFIGSVALYAGAAVCNYIADLLSIAGTIKALALVPVLFLVSWAVAAFFLLGLRKFNRE